MVKTKYKSGIALVSVLFIALAVMILALTFSRMVVSESQAAGSSRTINESLHLADGVSERARLKVFDDFKKSFLKVEKFLAVVEGNEQNARVTLRKGTVYTETIGETTGYWEIRRIQNDSESAWIEVAATAKNARGVQTVLRRIGMGKSNIFDLAMLSERTDCMYCHLRVRGDVGQLYHMRPGHGEEGGKGIGSGTTSRVYGNAYAARSVSNDNSDLNGDPKTINSAKFDDILTNYRGEKLPQDLDNDGIPDFPSFERQVAEASADGTLSGGIIYKQLKGSVLSSVPTTSNAATLDGVYDGNLYLEGKPGQPIKLSGDVYVTGDVIIKGEVEGQGAIYTGRNIYVAGNINYTNANADCWKESDPDVCAQQDIISAKDELRLAARGNLIIGDYTEKKADGTDKLWAEAQASMYFREQFSFNDSDTKYYDKVTGDELSCSTNSTPYTCKNADGQVINTYTAVPGVAAYDYSLKPGQIKPDGSFEAWLDDTTYQDILGRETRPYNTWRYGADGTRNQITLDTLKEQFAAYNVSDASLVPMLCTTRVECDNKRGLFEMKDLSNNVIGLVHWGKSGSDTGVETMRVMMNPRIDAEKQVTRIDAFLFANQRIAGKTFMAPTVINGGLIAKDIGVLAPGIRKEWWMNSSYDFLDTKVNNPTLDCTDRSSLTGHGLENVAFNPDADNCALTVNYDFRIRNGGFGFNLVGRNAGQTVGWQIAAKRSDHVTGP